MSSPVKNIVIVLVVLPVVILAGIKGYMHYKLKDSVELIAKNFSMVGKMKYGSLSTSLIDGEMSVRDIQLTLHGYDDVIRIKSITYTPPNLMALLKMSDNLRRGRFPESLQLSVKGLYLDLFGDLTDKLEDLIENANAEMHGINKLCGGRLYVGPRELRNMGYEEITTDFSLGYKFDKLNDELQLDWNLQQKDMGNFYLRATIVDLRDTTIASIISQPSPPRIGRFKIHYDDKSYVKRMVKSCAKRSNMGVAEYIDAESQQSAAYFASIWGVIPGPGLRQAYREFLTKPQTIDIRFELPSDVSLEQIRMFKPEDIPQMIQLSVQVNGKPVKDVSFAFNNDKELAERFRGLFGRKNVKKKVHKNIEYSKFHFVHIPLKKLPRYTGYRVRLLTDAGKTRKGTLVRITANQAHLQRRLSGGVFSMTVPIKRIRKAEVWMRTIVRKKGQGSKP